MIPFAAEPVHAEGGYKYTGLGLDNTLWTGVEAYFQETWYFNENNIKVTSVTSSNPAVLKVERQGKKTNIDNYWLKPKKAGKATITVKYKTKAGKAKTEKLTRPVKQCPKVFKSLKVNGKNIDLSSNKTEYVAKYTGTAPKIKLEMAGDWQIVEKWGSLEQPGKNGNWKQEDIKGITRRMLKEGKAFKFPKKWNNFLSGSILRMTTGKCSFTGSCYTGRTTKNSGTSH